MCCVPLDGASYIRQSDLGQCIANHQGYTRLHTFACCFRERKNISHLMSAGNILWQSNNPFHIPFECLTMCLQKEATKEYNPQGLFCGYFDPADRHWQVHFNRRSRLFFPLRLLYAMLWDDSSDAHIKRKQHNITMLRNLKVHTHVCEGIGVKVRRETCSLACRWRLKEL